MSLNDLKEQFSFAYVRAVAHAAGYFVLEADRMQDVDGVDLTLLSRSTGGTVRSPRLDLQVKATAQRVTEDPFPFDLGVKNYDELRSDEWQVPRILVVVLLPRNLDSWVVASEKSLMLRRCGYWKSLRGNAAKKRKKTTVRVRIDRSACFHVDQVRSMMTRIRNGRFP